MDKKKMEKKTKRNKRPRMNVDKNKRPPVCMGRRDIFFSPYYNAVIEVILNCRFA